MKVDITYPPVSKRNFQRKQLLDILKWPFLLAGFVCPVVNIAVGGRAWSVVAVSGLYMIWTLAFSTDLVEYNRISQFIKLIFWATFMCGMIEIFIAPGWAVTVLPIVWFSGLLVAGALFFTDFTRQRQNMLPMLMYIVLSLIGAIVGMSVKLENGKWAYIVLGALAAVLLAACAVSLGRDFLRELKRRFHIR